MTRHWLEPLARAGYAAKGVLYLLIGGLAAEVALEAGGATTNSRGAFRVVRDQPFGSALLGILAVGLGGYAIWRPTARAGMHAVWRCAQATPRADWCMPR